MSTRLTPPICDDCGNRETFFRHFIAPVTEVLTFTAQGTFEATLEGEDVIPLDYDDKGADAYEYQCTECGSSNISGYESVP